MAEKFDKRAWRASVLIRQSGACISWTDYVRTAPNLDKLLADLTYDRLFTLATYAGLPTIQEYSRKLDELHSQYEQERNRLLSSPDSTEVDLEMARHAHNISREVLINEEARQLRAYSVDDWMRMIEAVLENKKREDDGSV